MKPRTPSNPEPWPLYPSQCPQLRELAKVWELVKVWDPRSPPEDGHECVDDTLLAAEGGVAQHPPP